VLAQSIAHDHPFFDGNKRTATLAAAELLYRAGLDLPLEECFDEAEATIIALATSQIGWEGFSAWLEEKCQPLIREG
jgi:prophage maintenance system killer protein